MKSPVTLCAFILVSNASFSSADDISGARVSLKNYGLAHCLAKQFSEDSAMRKDISRSLGAYHFSGRGLHIILQNEDTFDILYDPYKETEKFVEGRYSLTSSVSKRSNKKMLFMLVLVFTILKNTKKFIVEQDKYIE